MGSCKKIAAQFAYLLLAFGPFYTGTIKHRHAVIGMMNRS